MGKIFIPLAFLILCYNVAFAQNATDKKGTLVKVDTTNDSWKNDPVDTQVKLSYKSDGITTRPAGTEFAILDNGRVGIGTSAPSWLLDVEGPLAIGQIRRINNGTQNQPPGFLFARARGAIGAELDINNLDQLGKIQFRGRISGGDSDYAALSYTANSATVGDGRFGFTNKTLIAEMMSILTSNGHVGIGNTTPSSTLQVIGSIATAITTISAATTLSDAHSYVIASGGTTYLVTLPAANLCTGRIYNIKTTGIAKTISSYIPTSGGAAINTLPLGITTLVSDGMNWQQF